MLKRGKVRPECQKNINQTYEKIINNWNKIKKDIPNDRRDILDVLKPIDQFLKSMSKESYTKDSTHQGIFNKAYG